MNAEELRKCNTTAFAYMGDAVYEQAVRERLMDKGVFNVNRMHHMATSYVKASAQAAVIRNLFDALTEDEQRLVKRARNRKYTTKAKNADPVTYKWATAFEALVGYLYLAGEKERLGWLLEQAMETIEKQSIK